MDISFNGTFGLGCFFENWNHIYFYHYYFVTDGIKSIKEPVFSTDRCVFARPPVEQIVLHQLRDSEPATISALSSLWVRVLSSTPLL